MNAKVNTEQPLMMPAQCVDCKFYDGFGQCLERGDKLKDNCENFELIEDCDMDYEEKYNAALERARELSKTVTGAQYDYIFPELKEEFKEAEDDKMWKLLKKYAHYNISDMALEADHITREQLESWLEKRIPIDKEEVKKGALKYVAGSFMKWLDTEISDDEMCLSDAECKVIEDAFLKEDWATVARYMREKLEEQDPCIGCTNDKGCVTCENGNLKEINVEPKFKPGDWIVDNCGYVWKIKEIQNQFYLLEDEEGEESPLIKIAYVNMTFHLWTIEDAKQGDVLANGHNILILKELDYDWSCDGTPNAVKAYCGIKPNGNFELGKENWCFCGTLYIHPATKEERKQLFQKMKEDGWEWDSKKKELKKVIYVREDGRIKTLIKGCIYASDITTEAREEIFAWLEKQSEKLDSDEVIAWVRQNICTACHNEPDVTISQCIDKFKKDFGL